MLHFRLLLINLSLALLTSKFPHFFQGTESVKGFRLRLTGCSKVRIDNKSFAKMNKLRLLKFHYKLLEIPDNGYAHKNIIFEGTQVDHSKSLEYLSNDLRLLYWHGFPFEFLPTTFYPECLVSLNLSYGNIKQLWTGSKVCVKLKFEIDFFSCKAY